MTANLLDPDRPLVACEGGPKHGQWFYADDFRALVQATERMASPYRPAAANVSLRYRQTTRIVEHPTWEDVVGRVMEWST